MKLRLYLLIFILSCINPAYTSNQNYNELEVTNCDELMLWIYSQLTTKNFEILYQRSMNKMILGLYELEKESQRAWVDDETYRKIKDELLLVNPEAENIFKQKFWPPYFLRDNPQFSSSYSILNLWKNILNEHPELSTKISDQYKVDKWDEMTFALIDKMSEELYPNTDFQKKLSTLHDALKDTSNKLIKSTDTPESINNLDQLNKDLLNSILHFLDNSGYNFDNICPRNKLIEKINKIACTIKQPSTQNDDLELFLKDIEKYIGKTDTSPTSIPIVTILDYENNKDKNVTFCRRSTNNLKYLVIHHTGTDEAASPEVINDYHVNHNNWYMLGYNYLISTKYRGASRNSPQVFSGRPPEMQGAHTGSKSLNLSSSDEQELKSKYQFCGNEQIGLTAQNVYEYSQELNESKKQKNGISGNFYSLGIAVIGNYEPITYRKVGKTLVPSNLLTKEVLTPNDIIIKKTAELSCDLQKKFPQIKTIVPHSFFKVTDCPGRLINFLHDIKKHAKSLGCNFNVAFAQEDKK